jgi:nicotinate-nucleotide pyrophosphorylase (carboxylating)
MVRKDHPLLMAPTDLQDTVARALAEDVGDGDRTAALIPATAQAHAQVVCRESAVLCGTPWFSAVFDQLDDNNVRLNWQAADGDSLRPDQVVCRLSGPARTLLTGERTALNFLQLLSGTATLARHYADAVAGTETAVLDTRKTIPGLRQAQKYAVRCGGCSNHRLGLFDAVLIKENHIMAAGSITQAVTTAQKLNPGVTIEVEVENLDELQEALQVQPNVIMLDNFTLDAMRQAVAMTAKRVKLEVSGNVSREHLSAIAATGVDYISVGALTKDIRAVDFSMRFNVL